MLLPPARMRFESPEASIVAALEPGELRFTELRLADEALAIRSALPPVELMLGRQPKKGGSMTIDEPRRTVIAGPGEVPLTMGAPGPFSRLAEEPLST
jgi:hypothetical protein